MISTQSHWFISVGIYIYILEYWFIGLYIYIYSQSSNGSLLETIVENKDIIQNMQHISNYSKSVRSD